jgi:hypothetical protein
MIDEILWLLRDGELYDLKEIMEKCSLPESKMKIIFSFLWEYDFVQIDENGRKVKLHPAMLNFMDEITRVEKEEASSHECFEGAVDFKEFVSLSRSYEEF